MVFVKKMGAKGLVPLESRPPKSEGLTSESKKLRRWQPRVELGGITDKGSNLLRTRHEGLQRRTRNRIMQQLEQCHDEWLKKQA
jgi:hypothetical protein